MHELRAAAFTLYDYVTCTPVNMMWRCNSVTYCSQILDDVGGVLGLCNLCWTKDVLKGGWGAPFHCKQKQPYVHVCFWLRSKRRDKTTKNRTVQRRSCTRASSTLGSYASAKAKLILEAQIKAFFFKSGPCLTFSGTHFTEQTQEILHSFDGWPEEEWKPHLIKLNKIKAKNICVYDSVITLWPLVYLLPLKGAAFTAGVVLKSARLKQNCFFLPRSTWTQEQSRNMLPKKNSDL